MKFEPRSRSPSLRSRPRRVACQLAILTNPNFPGLNPEVWGVAKMLRRMWGVAFATGATGTSKAARNPHQSVTYISTPYVSRCRTGDSVRQARSRPPFFRNTRVRGEPNDVIRKKRGRPRTVGQQSSGPVLSVGRASSSRLSTLAYKINRESFRKLDSRCGALCCKTRRMSDSNVVIRKKRGRPRIGQIPVVSFRLEPEWRQEIDEWRSGEPGHPSRSGDRRLMNGAAGSPAIHPAPTPFGS